MGTVPVYVCLVLKLYLTNDGLLVVEFAQLTGHNGLPEGLLRDGAVLPPEDAMTVLVALFRLPLQLHQLVPCRDGSAVASHGILIQRSESIH